MVFVWCGCWCIQCAVFPHFLRKILFSFFFFFYFSTSVLLFCWEIRCDWAERGSPQSNSRLVFLFFTCWRTVVHNKEMERCAVTDVDWRSETCPPLWWPVMKVSNPHRNQKIKETTKPNNRWSKQTYTVYIPVVDLIIISDEWRSQNSNSRRPTLGQPNTHNSQI